MAYVRQFGEVLPGEPVVLVPTGARTANGTGPTVPTLNGGTLRLDLTIDAIAGTTPTITVAVEHSPNGTQWSPLGAFAAATAVGTQRLVRSGLDRYVRATWTVGGTTPAVTFSVTGELV